MFKPKLKSKKVVSTKVPNHIKKYIDKYAVKGLKKKVRQEVTGNWPIHSSKKLRSLSVDRFFRKHYFRGPRWNGRLEKSKINTQLRILDPLGPLAVLWAEAEKISKKGQGMDPSDVIQLVQRAIVLIGNAHFVFNTERRKAIMAKCMPENLDMLTDKDGARALNKCKGDLFGKPFLKLLAKESKDNKELKDLLSSSKSDNKKGGYKKSNVKNDQFFQNRLSNNLQFGSQNPVSGQTRRNFVPQNNQPKKVFPNNKGQYPSQRKPSQ